MIEQSANHNSMISAALWLQQTMLGSAATVISMVGIASIGIVALTGTIDLKRGGRVALGCFLLFGTPYIVSGLLAVFGESGPPPMSNTGQTPAEASGISSSNPFDPYAGLAVKPQPR